MTAVQLTLASALALVVSTTAAGAQSQVIFSAPDGQGRACTEEAPCALDVARDRARSLLRRDGGDVEVRLARGVYRLSSTFELGARDGAPDGRRVVWRAAEHAQAVFSGARPVTGWTEVPGRPGVWRAAVAAPIDTRNLTVDGARMRLAQGAPPARLTPQFSNERGTGYTFPPSAGYQSWRNPQRIEVVFQNAPLSFNDSICPVEAISNGRLTVQEPCFSNTQHRDPLMGPVFAEELFTIDRIQNAFELLDEPGEFYHDPDPRADGAAAGGVVYLVAPNGANPNAARVEMGETQGPLLAIVGTERTPVKNLAVEGITFTGDTYLQPRTPDGFSEISSNVLLKGVGANEGQGICFTREDTHYEVVPGGKPGGKRRAGDTCPFAFGYTPQGAVFVYGAENVSFHGNVFRSLAKVALKIDASKTISVTGNLFEDVGSNGVQIGEVELAKPTQDQMWRIPHDVRVANNLFRRIGAEFTAAGIFAGYTVDTAVEHNELSDLPWAGMELCYGFRYDRSTAPSVVCEGSKIFYNKIERIGLTTEDLGGIRMIGPQGGLHHPSMARGAFVVGNQVLDFKSKWNALYPDEGAQFITYTDNVTTPLGSPIRPGDGQNNAPAHRDIGGCSVYGDILYEGNYWRGFSSFDCDGLYPAPEILGTPATPTSVTPISRDLVTTRQWRPVTFKDNTLIKGVADVPEPLRSEAGLEPAFAPIRRGDAPGRVIVFDAGAPAREGVSLDHGPGFKTCAGCTLPSAFGDTLLVAAEPGAEALLRFTGTQAKIYAQVGPGAGALDIAIGGRTTQVNLDRTPEMGDRLVYDTGVLPHGRHEVVVRVSSAGRGGLDRVDVFVPGHAVVEE